jgi:hypothetical protein
MLFGVTRIDPEGRARRSNGGDERVNSRAPMAPLIEVNTLRKRSGDIEAVA